MALFQIALVILLLILLIYDIFVTDARLNKMEKKLNEHFNSMISLEFKKNAPLLSEQMNQLVQPHRVQLPLSIDRVLIPEEYKDWI